MNDDFLVLVLIYRTIELWLQDEEGISLPYLENIIDLSLDRASDPVVIERLGVLRKLAVSLRI